MPHPARDENDLLRRIQPRRGLPAVPKRAPESDGITDAKLRKTPRPLPDDRVDHVDATRFEFYVVNRERTTENRIRSFEKTQHDKLPRLDAFRKFGRDQTNLADSLRYGLIRLDGSRPRPHFFIVRTTF